MTKWLLLVVMVMVAWPRDAGSVFPASRYTHVVPSGVYMKADMNNLGSEVTGIESIFDATTLAGPPLNNGILIGNGTVFKVDALPTGCTASNSALYYDDTAKDVLCHNIASGAFDATATTNLIWSNGAPSLDWRFDVTGSTDPHLVVSPSLSQFNNGSFIITSGPTPIAPDAVLHVDSDNQATMALDSHYNVDNTHSATIYGRRSRGTHAAMTGVAANDNLMTVTAMGRDSAGAWGFAGALEWSANQTWTNTAHGSNVILYSIRSNTTAQVPALSVDGTGDVTIADNLILSDVGQLRLKETAPGANFTGFVAPTALGTDLVYILPSVAPTTDGQVLAWHTGNLLAWDAAGVTSVGTDNTTFTVDQDLLTGTEPANNVGITFGGTGTVKLLWDATANNIVFSSTVSNTKVAFPDPGTDLRVVNLTDNASTCPVPAAGSTNVCSIGGALYARAPADATNPYKVLTTNAGTVGDFQCTAGFCIIGPNAVTSSKLAHSLTFVDGDLVSFGTVTPNTSTEGLVLPQSTSCTGATGQGQTCWNTVSKTLCIGDGASTCVPVSGGVAGAIKKAVVFRAPDLDIDGTVCTRPGGLSAEGVQVNGGPIMRTITCTDGAGAIYGRTFIPSNWDAGAVQLMLQGYSTSTTPAETLGFDVSCMVRGDNDVINFTWGASQTLNLVFSVLNRTEMVTSPNIVCDAAAPGKTLYWRAVVNTGATTTTQTNTRVTGAVLSYTGSYADEVVLVTTTTTTTTTTSTTTTTLAGAGNWVDDMIAVWMLDEAGTTTRVAAPNTVWNTSASLGTPTNDTTNRMQGAAALLGNGASMMMADPLTQTVAPPLTFGCWARNTDVTANASDAYFFSEWDFSVGGFAISWVAANDTWRALACKAAGVCVAAGTTGNGADNTFAHIVGQIPDANTVRVFKNGAQNGADVTGTAIYVPDPGDWFRLGGGQTLSFTGQVDECFWTRAVLTPADICRICSCGIDGSLCSCSGASYVAPNNDGRRTTTCGSCSLTGVACNQAAPN